MIVWVRSQVCRHSPPHAHMVIKSSYGNTLPTESQRYRGNGVLRIRTYYVHVYMSYVDYWLFIWSVGILCMCVI